MLEVLLVIAGALLVLFGGMYIMSRIDRWIREEGFAAEEGLAGGMENVKEEDREMCIRDRAISCSRCLSILRRRVWEAAIREWVR